MKLISTRPTALPTLPQGFEFSRALTRGRIEGLQSALRLLTQQSEATELSELRLARLSLCDRLQADYAKFLGDAPVDPGHSHARPQASSEVSRRLQLRQLLQEDLAWVSSLPGDHQDLARALRAGLERASLQEPR